MALHIEHPREPETESLPPCKRAKDDIVIDCEVSDEKRLSSVEAIIDLGSGGWRVGRVRQLDASDGVPRQVGGGGGGTMTTNDDSGGTNPSSDGSASAR